MSLDHIAHSFVQSGLENLQGWKQPSTACCLLHSPKGGRLFSVYP